MTISNVLINDSGNHWGKVKNGYIYMGNLLSMREALIISDVFLKQEKTNTCTLCAATMMLRRYAILKGNSYSSITESDVRKVAWGDNGLKGEFTYNGVKVHYLSPKSGKYEQFISLLADHPEGIVIYDFSHSNKAAHAILLLDYDPDSDTFYIADPATGKGRVPLSQSTTAGTDQTGKINEIDKIWYIP